MTEAQKRWQNTKRLMDKVKLKELKLKPDDPFRAWCFEFCTHPNADNSYFDGSIMGCIMLNVIVMCLQHYGLRSWVVTQL